MRVILIIFLLGTSSCFSCIFSKIGESEENWTERREAHGQSVFVRLEQGEFYSPMKRDGTTPLNEFAQFRIRVVRDGKETVIPVRQPDGQPFHVNLGALTDRPDLHLSPSGETAVVNFQYGLIVADLKQGTAQVLLDEVNGARLADIQYRAASVHSSRPKPIGVIHGLQWGDGEKFRLLQWVTPSVLQSTPPYIYRDQFDSETTLAGNTVHQVRWKPEDGGAQHILTVQKGADGRFEIIDRKKVPKSVLPKGGSLGFTIGGGDVFTLISQHQVTDEGMNFYPRRFSLVKLAPDASGKEYRIDAAIEGSSYYFGAADYEEVGHHIIVLSPRLRGREVEGVSLQVFDRRDFSLTYNQNIKLPDSLDPSRFSVGGLVVPKDFKVERSAMGSPSISPLFIRFSQNERKFNADGQAQFHDVPGLLGIRSGVAPGTVEMGMVRTDSRLFELVRLASLNHLHPPSLEAPADVVQRALPRIEVGIGQVTVDESDLKLGSFRMRVGDFHEIRQHEIKVPLKLFFQAFRVE